MGRLKTAEEFEEDLKVINNNIFILTKYSKSSNKVTIQCKICFNIWSTYPFNLLKGHGCNVCAVNQVSKSQTKTHEKYLIELNNSKLTYFPLEEYITARVPILHLCRNCSHIWKVSPNNILRGFGCPICAEAKRNNMSLPCNFYYIKITNTNNKIVYKVGITNSSIKTRFADELSKGYKIEILLFKYFSSRKEAYALEQRILVSYTHKKYKGEKFLARGGDSELFKEALGIEESIDKLIELNEFWEELR